jgi:hypothetical protein
MNAQFLDEWWMAENIFNCWEKNWSLFGSERYYGNCDCENPCSSILLFKISSASSGFL